MRRTLNIAVMALGLGAGGFPPAGAEEVTPLDRDGAKPAAASVVAERGYYLCFMRQPTFGLGVWKEMLDGFAEDRANTIILWMGGAFRSRKFPVTWQWAKEHENVKADFGRELIGHAHRLGIRVLLGFTPFGYDGVNQLPLEKPELKAIGSDGRPVREFGIGCWGWNICPAKAESQRFMREYVREMAFEFYPEADGLFIESSDYAICHCPDCGPKFFDHEFAFVSDISRELWERRPGATVVVYPHYFSGAKLRFSFGEGTAARQPFDPRWTLFFTPHSAAIEPALIARARGAWWWNEAPSRFDLAGIRAGVKRARDAKCSGYVPSLECYSYVTTRAESGEPWLVGRRQVPFGFGWLQPGANPYRALPVRAVRLAWRELTANPELSDTELRARLGRDLFGPGGRPSDVNDLLFLLEIFNTDRDWSVPGALTAPGLVRSRAESGRLDDRKRVRLRAQLAGVRSMADQRRDATNAGLRELHHIASWLAAQWTPADEMLLAQNSRERPASEPASVRVLVFSKTTLYRHASIPNGIAAIRRLGADHGFAVDATEEAGVFTEENLRRYRAVVFLSTSGDILDERQQEAFRSYLTGGGGLVGVHAAVAGKVATEGLWPWYVDTLCTEFDNHKAIEQATVLIEDRTNVSMAHLPAAWSRTDEWYNFTASPRGRARVLATLDEKSFHGGTMGADHPVVWCRRVGRGRLWYTALGHTEESYHEPHFLRHLLGGIQIAAGVKPAELDP